MAEFRRWVVTISPDRPITQVVNDLRGVGFTIGRVLEEVGCVTGTGADDTVEKVRNIAGVVDVSPDVPIDIGPPDSPVTW